MAGTGTTRLRRAIQEIGGVLHEPFGDLDIDGCKLAWTHGNDRGMLRELEYCDYFDFLFHGHTHVAGQRRRGKTLIANPGALFRASQKTFAILDLSTRTLETIEVHDDE